MDFGGYINAIETAVEMETSPPKSTQESVISVTSDDSVHPTVSSGEQEQTFSFKKVHQRRNISADQIVSDIRHQGLGVSSPISILIRNTEMHIRLLYMFVC